MNCTKKISLPLINELYNDRFGRRCIIKNLFHIFLAAKAQGETPVLEMLFTKFAKSELESFSSHKSTPLLITLTKYGYPFNKLQKESLITEEFELSEKGLKEVMEYICVQLWNKEIAIDLLTHQALNGPEKKTYRYNIFLKAKLNMDENVLGSFKEVYPDEFNEFSKAKTSPSL
jgi:hypothetical protein